MKRFHPTMRRAGVLMLAAGLVSGCHLDAGLGGGESAQQAGKQVVLATHDSWAMRKSVIKDFERQTGLQVVIRPQGDAGELTNRLVLTKDAPIADAVFGIDNTFATRALSNGVLARSTLPEPPGAARFELPQGRDRLMPVDYGDVCANIDTVWFAKHHLAAPRNFADLTKPAYKNLLVTEGATTSSTGFAFLLATISKFGPRWPAYWKRLMANGAKVDDGWDQAYYTDFTQGGGKGSRPIVMSYASSPPYTIPKGATKPTTKAVLGTCFRQVEYAGVLSGAKNPSGAAKLVRFLQAREFQDNLAEQMYVYPVNTSASVPKAWRRWAPLAKHTFNPSPAQIARHRDAWLNQWRNLVSG